MDPNAANERRQFSRVAFEAPAELITTDRHMAVQVLDLSLKGALLTLPEDATELKAGSPCLVKVHLGDLDDTTIAIAGEVAHLEGRHAGVLCRSIDLDSVTHLRRLIAMNLGDAALLDRDLKALIQA